jgi:hypothetical protein
VSKIKNLSTVGWVIVGLVAALVLVPTADAFMSGYLSPHPTHLGLRLLRGSRDTSRFSAEIRPVVDGCPLVPTNSLRLQTYGGPVLTIYGVTVLTLMMVMYALERRDERFILAFAAGCALSSSYGFASGAWPFGVVEAIWSLIALHRFFRKPPAPAAGP